MLNKIHNESCLDTMKRMEASTVDVVLTSPFYNTNKHAGNNGVIDLNKVPDGNIRYDMHVDNMTDEEYCDFTVDLFNGFDKVLKPNGCVLYNISYGAENVTGMFDAMYAVTHRTNFTIADVICWKKASAFPNSCSPNRLTRIWEFVFVCCRKDEEKTFFCNKKISSRRETGQLMYENVFNFIEAKNNDGTCPYNKATYSTDLCTQLLTIYAPKQCVVYDPFMGSGTTAVACKQMGFDYIGSEISPNQIKWAEDRLSGTTVTTSDGQTITKQPLF